MDKRQYDKEVKRLKELLNRSGVPEYQRDVLEPIIDNLACQKIKLEEAREELKKAGVVCEYNNGGNQTGTRENPLFTGYIKLWRAYMIGFEKFTSYLPKEAKNEAAPANITVLDQVRKMKEAKHG